MPRLLVVLGICLLAVALGAATVWLTRKESGNGPRGAPAWKTPSGQLPSVHVFGTEEQKRTALRSALTRLTSGQATELGSLKDDLALLADDPAVIREILNHFHRRAHLTRYEASGFADVFALVRHPSFVAPTSRLLDHEEWLVRRNAIVAALTQADPSLTPQLDREYVRLITEHPGEGGQTREEIVRAAVACGGDHLPVLLDRGFRDSAAGVRSAVAEAVAELKLTPMVPRLLELLEDSHPQVRLRAAWSLLAMGQGAGKPVILDALDPKEEALALQAIDAACTLRLPDAIPILRRHRKDAGFDLRASFVIALVLLNDQETIATLEADLERDPEDADVVELALAGLSAASEPRHLPALRAAARAGGRRLAAVLRGLAAAEGTADRDLVKAILSNPQVPHPVLVASIVPRAGEALIPFLVEELSHTRDENRAALWIECLGLIGTDAARKALIEAHDHWPGLVEQRVRLLDLARRRKGGLQ